MPIRTTPGREFFTQDQPLIMALMRAFDDLSNPAIVTDPDANILWANSAIERRSGYVRTEIIGRNPGSLWGGHMPDAFYKDMWRTIKEERRVFVGKLQNRTRDGRDYWQYLFIAPVLDTAGKIHFYVAFEFDAESPTEEEKFVILMKAKLNEQLQDPRGALSAFVSLLAETASHEGQREELAKISTDAPGLVELFDLLVGTAQAERHH